MLSRDSRFGAIKAPSVLTRRGIVLLAAGVAAASLFLSAQAPSRQPADRVAERIAALERESAALAAQSRTLLGEVRKLEVERDLRTLQARQAEESANAARRELVDVGRKLEALEKQRVNNLPALRQQLVDLYQRGQRAGWALLLNADGPREFARASRAAAALAYRRQRVFADHQRTLADLRAEREALTTQTRELRAQEARAQAARQSAERAVASRAALLDDIDRRRDLTAQYLGELQQAHDRLSRQVAARADARVVEATSVPVAPFRGALDWPVPGRIVGRFGQPGAVPGSVRSGIDLAAPVGTGVRAVHDGVVDYAEGFTGLGTLVILNHGSNTFSLYGYLDETLVKRGDSVQAGAEVGRVGRAPVGNQSALYFELRVDGRLVDPVEWLKPR
jgi:septal ring factor EnvC (AmiA/AmiB activator)